MCCCHKTIILDLGAINNLHTTPIPAIVPPNGYGVRFTCPPQIRTDAGSIPFSFSNAGFIELNNGASSFSGIAAFPSSFVTNPGTYQASSVLAHKVGFGNDSTVSIYATSAISGGSSTASIFIDIWYCLVEE
jgi:hypothetical protein